MFHLVLCIFFLFLSLFSKEGVSSGLHITVFMKGWMEIFIDLQPIDQRNVFFQKCSLQSCQTAAELRKYQRKAKVHGQTTTKNPLS